MSKNKFSFFFLKGYNIVLLTCLLEIYSLDLLSILFNFLFWFFFLYEFKKKL